MAATNPITPLERLAGRISVTLLWSAVLVCFRHLTNLQALPARRFSLLPGLRVSPTILLLHSMTNVCRSRSATGICSAPTCCTVCVPAIPLVGQYLPLSRAPSAELQMFPNPLDVASYLQRLPNTGALRRGEDWRWATRNPFMLLCLHVW